MSRRTLLLGAAVLGSLVLAAPAAATVVVGPGCTLQAAVTAANNRADSGGCSGVDPGGQTMISVPAGQYVLSTGELKFTAGASVKVIGAGQSSTVIDGNHVTRDIEVAAGAGVVLESLQVTGGKSLDGVDGCNGNGSGCPGVDGGGIYNAGSLTLNHVTVTGNATGRGGNGNNGVTSDGGPRNGQAANHSGAGGGIASIGNLSITDSTISNNHTGPGGTGGTGVVGQLGLGHIPAGGDGGAGGASGAGGGIWIGSGSATIATTTISGNFTGAGGAGGNGGNGVGEAAGPPGQPGQPWGDGGDGGNGGNNGRMWTTNRPNTDESYNGGGGGIATYGDLTVTSSTISGNATGAGGHGGGAGVPGKHLDNTWSGNQGGGLGGGGGFGAGLLAEGTSSSATLTNVTLANNHAGAGGGGGAPSISGTRRPGEGGFGGEGGGVWATGFNGHGTVELDHATVALNSAGAGGAADDNLRGADGVGGGVRVAHRFQPVAYGLGLRNTIVTANGVPNCSEVDYGNAYPDDISDHGNNLRYQVVAVGQPADASCPGATGDPKLGSLQNNGGPTFTMLPALGSAAIDAGTCDVATDQRGVARPLAGCDIGAVEAGALPPPTGTQTGLGASPNPSTAGQAVTYTATVTPAPNGGTVAFTDNGTVIAGCGARALTAGKATCITSYGAAGSRAIKATYSGTAGYTGSSSTLTQVVKPNPAGGKVAPRNTALPTLAGSTTAGQTLTTTRGAWTGTAPITYAVRWQRCEASCATIPGATGSAYTLTAADIGRRVRAQIVASNAAGTMSAFSTQSGIVVPVLGKVQGFLGTLTVPKGKSAKIGAILKAGGYTFTATAPSPGTLSLSWYSVPKGAHAVAGKPKAVLVASVKRTVTKAGRVRPKLKLTKKGRKLLKKARTLKLTAKQSFKPTGGRTTTVRRTFKLRR